MSQDVRDLLNEAMRQVPRRPGDLDAVRQRARHRQLRQRVVLASAVAAVVLVGALVVVPAFQGPTAPVIGPSDDEAVTELSVEELRAAVSSATAALREAPGLEGVQRAFIDGHLATAVWFTSRAGGDTAVVQSVDVDVRDSGWWLIDDEPPGTGRDFATTAWIMVGDVLHEATATNGQPDQPWLVSEPQPPVRLAFGLAILDAGTDLIGTPDQRWSATRHDLEDGRALLTLSAPYQDGRMVQRWEMAAGGELTSWTFEVIDVTRQPLQIGNDVMTSCSIEYRTITDPEPMTAPVSGTDLNLARFDLPDEFPIQPR